MRYLLLCTFLAFMPFESAVARQPALEERIEERMESTLRYRIQQLEASKVKFPVNQHASIDRQIRQIEDEIARMNSR